MGAVWIDGRLVDDSDARVSVFDHGLTVGDGVFETLLCYPDAGLAFAPEHLARLRRSAAGLGLTVPYDDVAIHEALRAVIDASPTSRAARTRVRITVTGGAGPLGSDRGGAPATVVVAATAQKPWPATAVVAPVPWTRNERSPLAGLKTTSYGENVVALNAAHEVGADEALFCDTQGRVSEGTGTNVFAVLAGVLVTPPLTTGCLAGITRAVVLRTHAAEERFFTLDELADATEVFLTSTTREVHAVTKIVGVGTWADTPGPATAAAAAAYTAARLGE